MMIHSKTALSNMPTTTLAEKDLVELLYQGKMGLLTADHSLLTAYETGCKALGQEQVFSVLELPESVEEAVKQWNTPAHIEELDLDVYFANKVNTLEEAVRVVEELNLYKEKKMIPMLRFMIYLVEVMKANQIVWGVGRGSSVSSFLLYLVGLHSINSVKYNLDIKEFIR